MATVILNLSIGYNIGYHDEHLKTTEKFKILANIYLRYSTSISHEYFTAACTLYLGRVILNNISVKLP